MLVKELLISWGKPHKLAASETVSRWIKDELSRAGVSISLYKAHVSRSLSSNKARDIGISVLGYIQDILTRTSWKMIKIND